MSDIVEGHDAILQALRDVAPEAMLERVPPKIFHELGVEFVTYRKKALLTATFPADERFANPMGTYQGGVLGGALDIVYGSLALLVTKGKPTVTLTLETSFHRPIAAEGRPFTVEARLRAAHGTTVFLEGSVKGPDGKVAATSATTMAIVKR